MKRFLSKLNCRSNQIVEDKKDTPSLIPHAFASRFLQYPRQESFLDKSSSSNALFSCVLSHEFLHPEEPSFQLDHLIQVLQLKHASLQRLHISGTFVSKLSLMEQHLFWHVLCHPTDDEGDDDKEIRNPSWPQLQFLSFADFGVDFPLPSSVLICLLESQRQPLQAIRQLDLSHVRLNGELTKLRQTLVSMKSLETIQAWDLDLVGSSNGSTSQLQVLYMLLQIKQLQTMSLGSFSFDSQLIEAITNALSTEEHSLKVLRLQAGCADSNDHNHNDNHHHYHPGMASSATLLETESCEALASMLKVNRSLEKLEFCNLHLVHGGKGLVAIAQALQHHNRTLKSFHLFQFDLFCRHDMTTEENDALVEMLRQNHVLQSFLPHGTGGEAHAQVEFHLKCNQQQLHDLHVDVNMSRVAMVDRLGSTDIQDDVDCLYYLLHNNPS